MTIGQITAGQAVSSRTSELPLKSFSFLLTALLTADRFFLQQCTAAKTQEVRSIIFYGDPVRGMGTIAAF